VTNKCPLCKERFNSVRKYGNTQDKIIVEDKDQGHNDLPNAEWMEAMRNRPCDVCQCDTDWEVL